MILPGLVVIIPVIRRIGRMQSHAIRRGYDLTSLSRKFYPDADFSDFDMIIGMDDQNIRDLQRMATSEEEKNKIFKMTDFCQRFSYRDSVPDPYYGGDSGFELVLDLLEDAVEGLLDQLERIKLIGKFLMSFIGKF